MLVFLFRGTNRGLPPCHLEINMGEVASEQHHQLQPGLMSTRYLATGGSLDDDGMINNVRPTNIFTPAEL